MMRQIQKSNQFTWIKKITATFLSFRDADGESRSELNWFHIKKYENPAREIIRFCHLNARATHEVVFRKRTIKQFAFKNSTAEVAFNDQ